MPIVKIISQNLDHKLANHQRRLYDFLNIVRDHLPHIVCVQEVSRDVVEKLLTEMRVLGYTIICADDANMRDTFEVTFSKLDMIRSEYVKYKNSTQGRGYIRTLFKVHDNNNVAHALHIINTQMDDPNSTLGCKNDQVKQVTIIPMFNMPYKLAGTILAGDTGIAEYLSSSVKHPDDWYDAWYECGNNEERYTINCDTNPIAPPGIKERPDRVWTKDCTVEEYKIIRATGANMISRHYGIYVEVSYC